MSSLESFLTRKKRNLWADPKHWREICPKLTISDSERCMDEPATSASSSAQSAEELKRRLICDGYALVDDLKNGDQKNGGTNDKEAARNLIRDLSTNIASLHQDHSYPATFILLYDETWQLAQFGSQLLSSSTHQKSLFNFDMLAWYVDPKEGKAGFSPHRDRQPDVARNSFHGDGQAKYVTLWVALTDATPENSCLYVIPKQFDPGYTDGDDIEGNDEDGGNKQNCDDPLRRALSTKESYQNIRALPRRAGQAVLFTHRIMHWGSRGNPNSHLSEPRIAVSFVSSDPSFETPYIDPSYFTKEKIPPFRIRLLLVCAQLLIYYQRFDVPKECIRACYDYVKEFGDELDATYRKKVFVEFVKAMKDVDTAGKGDFIVQVVSEERNDAASNGADDEGEDNDEEEAVLEEMIEAERGGYGEFRDDFDDMDDGDRDRSNDDEVEEGSFDEEEEDGDGECLLFRKRKGTDCDSDAVDKTMSIRQKLP